MKDIREKKKTTPRICIVGAGLTGLVCGRELAKRGFQVQLLEQNPAPGGMLASAAFAEKNIELIPHHLRRQDKYILDLYQDLNLLSEIEWHDAYWYGRVRKRKLGYPKEGFQSFLFRLTTEILESGNEIFNGYTVMNILPAGADRSGYTISCVLENGKTVSLTSDVVLFTGSCRNFAHISNNLPLPTDYSDPLMDISYQGNICFLLLCKKGLSDCYSKPFPTSAPFQKMIEHTNLVGSQKYGYHVLYLTGTMSPLDPLWTKPDAEIYKTCLSHLSKMIPSFSKKDILHWRLTRTRYAMPTSRAGTNLLKAGDNLFLCSMAMAGEDTPGAGSEEFRMNSCVKKAMEICQQIYEKM